MRCPPSVFSRRKKNPSTISRSRPLASCAERRVVLGGGVDCKVAQAHDGGERRTSAHSG